MSEYDKRIEDLEEGKEYLCKPETNHKYKRVCEGLLCTPIRNNKTGEWVESYAKNDIYMMGKMRFKEIKPKEKMYVHKYLGTKIEGDRIVESVVSDKIWMEFNKYPDFDFIPLMVDQDFDEWRE